MAIEIEIEDVDSAGLTCDSPLTLGNLELNFNNGATLVSTCELDLLGGSVGSGEHYELCSSAARSVLNKEGELTSAGNADLDRSGLASDLNRLGVLYALVGLGSVSDFGAGNDNKLTVNIVLVASAGYEVADVKLVANVLKFNRTHVALIIVVSIDASAQSFRANVALVILVLILTFGKRLAAKIAVVILIIVSVAERLANEGSTVHTECSLGTGSGAELEIVLECELLAAFHTFAALTAGEEPVVVAIG